MLFWQTTRPITKFGTLTKHEVMISKSFCLSKFLIIRQLRESLPITGAIITVP